MEYLPQIETLALTVFVSLARFENQRWVRARQGGLRGGSQNLGLFVDFTGAISSLFMIGFYLAYWYDFSILHAMVLFGCSWIIVMVCSLLFLGDRFFVWVIGTIMTWVLVPILFVSVSWFGVFF